MKFAKREVSEKSVTLTDAQLAMAIAEYVERNSQALLFVSDDTECQIERTDGETTLRVKYGSKWDRWSP